MKRKILGIFVYILLITGVVLQASENKNNTNPLESNQDPDPNGWDVNATLPMIVADDFICDMSGAIKAIIFWGSWKGDNNDSCGHFPFVSIHENLPVGHPNNPNNYAIPGTILWSLGGLITVETEMAPSQQGWCDPVYNVWLPEDHQKWFEYNCDFGMSGFSQTVNTHYWLSIRMDVFSSSNWGWKTALNQSNNCSVWGNPNPLSPGGYDWYELRAQNGDALDMSFVLIKDFGVDISWDDSSISLGNPPFDITNLGTAVIGVDWVLNYYGGIMLSGRQITGHIILQPKETKTVKSTNFLFGFGPVEIKATAQEDGKLLATATTAGFVFGPFIFRK